MVKALKASSIALTIVAALAGCAVGPNYKRPETPVAPQFAGAEASTYQTTQAPQVQFWRQFDDDTLDQLVSDALTANHDLRIALGNLVEARGLRGRSWCKPPDPEMRVEENSELTAAQSVLGRPKSASPFSNRGFILTIPSGRGMNRIVVRVRIEIRQTFRYPASERRIEPCEDRGRGCRRASDGDGHSHRS